MAKRKSDLELRAERINYEGDLALENLKRFNDGVSVGKGYTDGCLSFHLYVGSASPYALEYFTDPVGDLHGTATADNRDGFMFVFVRDGTKGFRPLNSLVRLVQVDSIYVRVRQICQRSLTLRLSATDAVEVFFSLTQGKLGSLRGGIARVHLRKFKNQILQSDSQIVDEIANGEWNLPRDKFRNRDTNVGLIADFVVIDNDALLVFPSGLFKSGQEFIQIYIGAFDPFTSSVKRMVNHG